MATILSFTELKVWQKARILCKSVHELTLIEKFANDYGLKNQISNSSGSIMDNIAEGFGRKGNREFINFLAYANGSALECCSQIYRAYDKRYISDINKLEIISLIDEITKMINAMIIYLGRSDLKGEKFKSRN